SGGQKDCRASRPPGPHRLLESRQDRARPKARGRSGIGDGQTRDPAHQTPGKIPRDAVEKETDETDHRTKRQQDHGPLNSIYYLPSPTMKSAYELAMERLSKASPTVKLTAHQKKEIADLESRSAAKIAERELFIKGEIAKAVDKGDF